MKGKRRPKKLKSLRLYHQGNLGKYLASKVLFESVRANVREVFKGLDTRRESEAEFMDVEREFNHILSHYRLQNIRGPK